MEKLKPCPFCGGEAMLTMRADIFDDGDDKYTVICVNNECLVVPQTLQYESPDKAIEAWNRRDE